MFSESLIIGLIVLLLCGAACFYMYVRMSFLEKKFVVIESILVDIRVAMDSLMMEHMVEPPAPIAMTPGVGMPPPVPSKSPEEAIPEESFYSSILEQAHDAAEVVQGGQTADAVLESFESSKEQKEVAPVATKPSLDSMTRSELVSLAESKGIRVKRSMQKGEILSLLRRVDPTQNESFATGAENVSGSAGGAQELGSSFDGVTPMDMGQNETLE